MSKTRYAERKAGQRAVSLRGARCAVCGTKGSPGNKLQRHHKTYKNGGKSVIVICQDCHTALHKRKKTWGRMSNSSSGE